MQGTEWRLGSLETRLWDGAVTLWVWKRVVVEAGWGVQPVLVLRF